MKTFLKTPQTRSGIFRSAYVIAVLLCVCSCVVFSGCAMLSTNAEPVQQSYMDQQAKILEVVPKGTHRDEVKKILEQKGIEGAFGGSQSIYYCDYWNRGKGEVWEMNIALLFDEEGKLYSTMPSKAKITQTKE